jgi:hypothetical protein
MPAQQQALHVSCNYKLLAMDTELLAEKSEKYIKPHMALIDAKLKEGNEKLHNLLQTDHNIIGIVVKCHLIIEYHLTEYLKATYKYLPADDANLSFYQKILLVPESDISVTWLLPSIKQLNKNRNKYAYNIFAEVTFADLNELANIVKSFRDISHNNVERLLLDYSILCSSFLDRSAPEVVQVFIEAFKKAREE